VKLPRQRTPRRLTRLPSPATAAALLAAVAFTLVGIGLPLVGHGVFAATDEMVHNSPYYDAGFADTPIRNVFLDDTYDAELPGELLFGQSTRDGSPALWNPYVSAGSPLGAIPNDALLSPISLPLYVLPGWLAPAYEKLLESAVAIAGCYLFLRRLRLRRPSALLGGTIFASSAFMVVWTNWPQTRVAAVIPWVFWALERLIQRRRIGDIVPLAAAVGAMLLGGFPAVTAFTLLTAGGYALARILAEGRRRVWLVVTALVAAVGGLALAAVQLLPFQVFYSSWLIEGRGQSPGEHLNVNDLVTSFAPWAYGVVGFNTGQPMWSHDNNFVEASSYVGVAALVLAVVALVRARAGRSRLPRAAWISLVVANGVWLLLIYGGAPLALLQHLPVFSSNFVGRARSVLGFLFAVLAATGFDLLLHREPGTARARRQWWVPGAVVSVVAVAAGVILALLARSSSASADSADPVPPDVPSRLDFTDQELLIAGALFAVAGLAVAALLLVRRTAAIRVAAVLVLLALVVGQGLAFVGPYWPRVDRSTFYPVTDTQRFLSQHLGHERYVGTTGAMTMGVDTSHRLRALAGHAFINARLATLIRAVPGNPIDYATHILFTADPDVAASPVLDRLGGKYFVTSPRDPVFGVEHAPDPAANAAIALTPGATITAPVPVPGPVRAVGVLPLSGGLPSSAALSVAVTDQDGVIVAAARRGTTGLTPGQPFYVPLTGDAARPDAQLTAHITLEAPFPLVLASSSAGVAALASVSPRANDGLRLVFAGSSVIYQRLNALARIRWAERAVVEPDADRRTALIAGGSVAPDQVVLDGPGPIAEGRPATVAVSTDGANRIDATVAADGAGYLVVADALQVGWRVTVDGQPAKLVAADQGVVAVAVGAGQHVIELRYDPPYHGWGSWLSVLAILAAAATLTVDQRLARWRAGRPGAEPRAAAPHIGGPSRP
jgi:hypothetical protein